MASKGSNVAPVANKSTRRKASWERGQVRKAARVKAQNERAEHNRFLRARGLPTPHEAKQIKRANIRRELHLSMPCTRGLNESCHWHERNGNGITTARDVDRLTRQHDADEASAGSIGDRTKKRGGRRHRKAGA